MPSFWWPEDELEKQWEQPTDRTALPIQAPSATLEQAQRQEQQDFGSFLGGLNTPSQGIEIPEPPPPPQQPQQATDPFAGLSNPGQSFMDRFGRNFGEAFGQTGFARGVQRVGQEIGQGVADVQQGWQSGNLLQVGMGALGAFGGVVGAPGRMYAEQSKQVGVPERQAELLGEAANFGTFVGGAPTLARMGQFGPVRRAVTGGLGAAGAGIGAGIGAYEAQQQGLSPFDTATTIATRALQGGDIGLGGAELGGDIASGVRRLGRGYQQLEAPSQIARGGDFRQGEPFSPYEGAIRSPRDVRTTLTGQETDDYLSGAANRLTVQPPEDIAQPYTNAKPGSITAAIEDTFNEARASGRTVTSEEMAGIYGLPTPKDYPTFDPKQERVLVGTPRSEEEIVASIKKNIPSSEWYPKVQQLLDRTIREADVPEEQATRYYDEFEALFGRMAASTPPEINFEIAGRLMEARGDLMRRGVPIEEFTRESVLDALRRTGMRDTKGPPVPGKNLAVKGENGVVYWANDHMSGGDIDAAINLWKTGEVDVASGQKLASYFTNTKTSGKPGMADFFSTNDRWIVRAFGYANDKEALGDPRAQEAMNAVLARISREHPEVSIPNRAQAALWFDEKARRGVGPADKKLFTEMKNRGTPISSAAEAGSPQNIEAANRWLMNRLQEQIRTGEIPPLPLRPNEPLQVLHSRGKAQFDPRNPRGAPGTAFDREISSTSLANTQDFAYAQAREASIPFTGATPEEAVEAAARALDVDPTTGVSRVVRETLGEENRVVLERFASGNGQPTVVARVMMPYANQSRAVEVGSGLANQLGVDPTSVRVRMPSVRQGDPNAVNIAHPNGQQWTWDEFTAPREELGGRAYADIPGLEVDRSGRYLTRQGAIEEIIPELRAAGVPEQLVTTGRLAGNPGQGGLGITQSPGTRTDFMSLLRGAAGNPTRAEEIGGQAGTVGGAALGASSIEEDDTWGERIGKVATGAFAGAGLGRNLARGRSAYDAGEEGVQFGRARVKTPAGAEPGRAITATAQAEAKRLKLEGVDDEVADIIVEAAANTGWARQQRRGIISDETARGLAEDEAANVHKWLERGKAGEAYNEEQIIAIGNAFMGQAAKTRAIGAERARLKAGGDAKEIEQVERKFLREGMKTAALYNLHAGAVTESGRALRASRKGMLTPEQALDKAHARVWAKVSDPARRDELFSEIETLMEVGDPHQIAKFWAMLERGAPTRWEWFRALRYNAMLSGFRTIAVDAVSNSAEIGWKTALDMAESGVRGDFKTINAEMRGMYTGMMVGTRAFSDFFSKGISDRMLQGQEEALLGDLINRTSGTSHKVAWSLEWPLRVKGAIDEFFRSTLYAMEIGRQSALRATKEGKTGADWDRRLAELIDNPDGDLMLRAERIADRHTFKGEMGEFGRALGQFQKYPLAWIAMPFLRTIYHITSRGIERSPLGLGGALWDVKKGKYNGPERMDISPLDERIRDGIAGSLGWGAFAVLASQGFISGAGPKEDGDKAALRATGWQPYSIKVLDTWTSYSNWGPVAIALSLAAAGAETEKYRKEDADAGDIATEGARRFLELFSEQSYLQGLGAAYKAMKEPDRFGEQWVTSFFSSLVPQGSALGNVAQAIDPVNRRADRGDIPGALATRIPVLREQQPVMQDPYGRPVENPYEGFKAFMPVRSQPIVKDPVAQEVARLSLSGNNVSLPRDEQRFAGVKQTGEQRRDIQRTVGNALHTYLNEAMASPAYQGLPDEAKAATLNAAGRTAREIGNIKLGDRVGRDPKARAVLEWARTPHFVGVSGTAEEIADKNFRIAQAKALLREYQQQYGPELGEAMLVQNDRKAFNLALTPDLPSPILNMKKAALERALGVTTQTQEAAPLLGAGNTTVDRDFMQAQGTRMAPPTLLSGGFQAPQADLGMRQMRQLGR